MIRAGKYPNASDNFKTDKWVLKMFEDFQDPCPYNPDFEIDGLKIPWGPKVFINPPYSNVTPWIQRAIQHTSPDFKTGQGISNIVVMLLKHDSSTKWFRLIHECPWSYTLLSGQRLRHQTSNWASFPSILVVFHNE